MGLPSGHERGYGKAPSTPSIADGGLRRESRRFLYRRRFKRHLNEVSRLGSYGFGRGHRFY